MATVPPPVKTRQPPQAPRLGSGGGSDGLVPVSPRVGGIPSAAPSSRYSVGTGTPPAHRSRRLSAGSGPSSGLGMSTGLGSVTDLGGIFAACRDATAELELAVRAAVSHREKCAVVLGAAMAVNIALAEADAVSPALDAFTQTQLKRLCSGILSTLGLAVARVRVYGQYTRVQKIVRLMRYRATEVKFDELRSDLEVLEGQLWNLTGAVGGLGMGGTVAPNSMTGRSGSRGGMRKLSAGPDTRHRLLRGGAHHWLVGGDVRVMCTAGVDGSELWWASNRSASLSAYDLFLQSQRNIDGIVAPSSSGDGGGGGGGSAMDRQLSSGSAGSGVGTKGGFGLFWVGGGGCLGICLGDVTAMASEEASALLWTGTNLGGVATWDTDAGCQWGEATLVSSTSSSSPRSSAVTALTPVAPGIAWVGLADGSILEVEAPESGNDRISCARRLCAPGHHPIHTQDEEALILREAECAGIVLNHEELTKVVDSPCGDEVMSVLEDSVRRGKSFDGGHGKDGDESIGDGCTARAEDEPAVSDLPSPVGAGKILKRMAGGSVNSLYGGLGWGTSSGRKRHSGVSVRELIRLGPLVWASCDDGVLEAW